MGAGQRTRAWYGDRAWSGTVWGYAAFVMVMGWPSSASICRMWFFDLLVFVGAGLVVAGAEVGEPVGGVGEQVPDDDQDGAGDGYLERGPWARR
jgi:hypothetical protein